MDLRRGRHAAALIAMLLPLGACDSLTETQPAGMEVRLRSQSSIAASVALAPSLALFANNGNPSGHGPISLDEVESIRVEILDVLVKPVDEEEEEGSEEEESTGWVSLDEVPAEPIEILDLGAIATLGILPADAAIEEIEAIRIVFGDAFITVAGEEETELKIPSGKVTLAPKDFTALAQRAGERLAELDRPGGND